MKIENTPRLAYKLLNVSDSELLWELDQDPEVMRFINGGICTTKKEIEEVYMPRLKSYTKPDAGWGLWGLFENGDSFIGWILVRPMEFFSENPETRNLELGWRLKRQSWGKGLATEAARAIMDALISHDACDHLTALALEENTASIKVMKRLGMKYLKNDIHRDPLGDAQCVYYRYDVKKIPN